MVRYDTNGRQTTSNTGSARDREMMCISTSTVEILEKSIVKPGGCLRKMARSACGRVPFYADIVIHTDSAR